MPVHPPVQLDEQSPLHPSQFPVQPEHKFTDPEQPLHPLHLFLQPSPELQVSIQSEPHELE